MADIWKLHFGGLLAWIIWTFVHIFYLIGFRNRVLVMIQWAWSYVTFGRGARIITSETLCTTAPMPNVGVTASAPNVGVPAAAP